MFSVQEGSEVGPLPHGSGKFGVLIWQLPLTLKPPIKIYKNALKSEKARIRINSKDSGKIELILVSFIDSRANFRRANSV